MPGIDKLEILAAVEGVTAQAAARVAFSMVKGMKISQARIMLEKTGSALDFFRLSECELSYLLGGRLPLASEQYREDLFRKALKECRYMADHHISGLWFEDNDFPSRLAECDDAPAMLYSYGPMDLNMPRMIAVVGTRHATNYGARFTDELIEAISNRLSGTGVVSGLAYGIDISAHRSCLEHGVPTAAVLAHGLDTIYPSEHRNAAVAIKEHGGALLSEYPSGTQLHRGNFLARNRIVAGLCDLTIVVESDIKGGAMVTARLARNYNREVGAVPGRAGDTYSRGTNSLIFNNIAALIASLEDICLLMGWEHGNCRQQPRLPVGLEPDEEKVIDYLRDHAGETVNEICIGLDMRYADLSALLFRMELKDLVVSLPGGTYSPL